MSEGRREQQIFRVLPLAAHEERGGQKEIKGELSRCCVRYSLHTTKGITRACCNLQVNRRLPGVQIYFNLIVRVLATASLFPQPLQLSVNTRACANNTGGAEVGSNSEKHRLSFAVYASLTSGQSLRLEHKYTRHNELYTLVASACGTHVHLLSIICDAIA